MIAPLRRWGISNAIRPIATVAILFVMVLSGMGMGLLSGVASPAIIGHLVAPSARTSPAAQVNPFGVSGLQINYFDVSPTVAVQGTTFNFTTNVTGGTGVYTYNYLNLPTGCTSSNASPYLCQPTGNGTFTVELRAVDSSGSNATANVTVDVWPFAVSPFFQVSQDPAEVAHAQQPCSIVNASPFYTAYCQDIQNSPSVLAFANGDVGLVSSATTDATNNVCPGADQTTSSRITESISTDSGVTFTPTLTLGGTACGEQNALEPSFAVSSTGAAYGVFVMENSTAAPGQYASRGSDSLGFVSSSNDGASWSSVTTIVSGGNVARPELAVEGRSVYVVYEDIANSSTPIPGGGLPISVRFLASGDGGSSWSTPVTMPGWNASQGNNAMSPAITVSGTGEVAVVYATNRSCVNPASARACYTWGDSIAALTSTTNGSSWSSVSWAATAVGETTCSLGLCESSFYQSTPDISAVFDSSGDLFVVYSGTQSQPIVRGTAGNYLQSGVTVALLANGATSWTSEALFAPTFGAPLNATNPGVGSSGAEVYVTYSQRNGTLGGADYSESYSQWFAEAAGRGTLSVSTPRPVDLQPMPLGLTVNSTQESFVGYTSSVGINRTSGAPMLAFSLPMANVQSVASSTTYYYANYTYEAVESFAEPTWVGSPLSTEIDFTTAGAAAGDAWAFTLAGLPFSTSQPGLGILDVPLGVEMVLELNPSSMNGYGVVNMEPPLVSVPSPYAFDYSMTVTVTFVLFFLLELGYSPNWLTTAIEYAEWEGQVYPNYSTCTICSAIYDYFGEQVDVAQTSTTNEYENYTYVDSSLYYGYGYCYGVTTPPPTKANLQCYDYYNIYNSYAYRLAAAAMPIPWQLYVEGGSTFYPYLYSNSAISYVNGTGSGSFSGIPTLECTGCTNDYELPPMVVNGPINETADFSSVTGAQIYNESVTPHGLPDGTTYHFTWNGTDYNGTSPSATPILDQNPGGYAVTNAWASGSSPGWEYFGSVVPAGPVIVPYQPDVNLSFTSYEDLNAPTESVAFHASGLSAGTPWSLSFNGTRYATTGAWVNVTVHPGTYLVATTASVSANGTTSYAAGAFGPTVTIISGEKQLNISFTPTNRLMVTASTGGLVAEVGVGSWSSSVTIWATVGSMYNFTENASAGWSFLGWTGTGAGSYTGPSAYAIVTSNGVITESAGFAPLPDARFNLTFQESGLPAGTWWTVDLKGVGYSSNEPTLTVPNLYAWVSGSVGRYALSVPYAYSNSTNETRFAVTAAPALVGTNGTLTPSVLLAFAPQQLITTSSSGGGTSLIEVNSTPSGNTVWGVPGGVYTLSEVASSNYEFTQWIGTGAGSYTGTETAPPVTVSTSPIHEYAEFSAVPAPKPTLYDLNVSLGTSLRSGTVWSVVLHPASGAAVGYSSTGTSLVITGLSQGTYKLSVNPSISPDGLAQYAPAPTNPSSVSLTRNGNVSVSFTTEYWVSVTGSPGGSAGPASGWQEADSPLALAALADSGYSFGGWIGTGLGSYTGAQPTDTVTVLGPITEVAQFEPVAKNPTKTTTKVGSSIWQSDTTLVLLAVVGLIIGLIVGMMLFRRGKTGRGPAETPAGPTGEMASSEGGDPSTASEKTPPEYSEAGEPPASGGSS